MTTDNLQTRCSHTWADSSTDDPINNGLTQFGRDVVREMNRLGMIVDVSHLSDEACWDVLEATSAPVIASHSNGRALTDHRRNLTDDMLRAPAENDGVVIVNFNVYVVDPEKVEYWELATGWHWFWRPGQPQTSLGLLVDHIVQVAGIDHVGLGSDFDGIPSPRELAGRKQFPQPHRGACELRLLGRGHPQNTGWQRAAGDG